MFKYVINFFFYEIEVDKFFKSFFDLFKEVIDFYIINDEMIYIIWKNKSNLVKEDYQINIFIVVFIICWVRLKFYDVLYMFEICVLYFDIDFVIFVSRFGDVELEIGFYFGEFINELVFFDDYIIEFVFGGFKNYVFRII